MACIPEQCQSRRDDLFARNLPESQRCKRDGDNMLGINLDRRLSRGGNGRGAKLEKPRPARGVAEFIEGAEMGNQDAASQRSRFDVEDAGKR